MKPLVVALAAFACGGCTMISLERNTIAQSDSVMDLRYRIVMENLAMVADDPAALPVSSTMFAGSVQVSDLAQLGSTTIWQYVKGVAGGSQSGFGSEAPNPQLSRTLTQNWTLDPAVVPEKLEALRCACRWVIYGPERACADCQGLLASPDQAPWPGRHFGVADRLERLPEGWLHVGRLKDVPAGACYKAHCGHTWVWVTPGGTEGLAGFTLVFLDIATIDHTSLETPILVNLYRDYVTRIPDSTTMSVGDKPLVAATLNSADKTGMKVGVVGWQETRVIKPEYKDFLETQIQQALEDTSGLKTVMISWQDWLNATTPYRGTRTNLSPQGQTAGKELGLLPGLAPQYHLNLQRPLYELQLQGGGLRTAPPGKMD
jgi:hypothetical protein